MANFSTAEYLTLDPWTALIRLINDHLYLQLEPRQAKLLKFTPKGNRALEVVINANRGTSNQNILPSLAPVTVTYNRLVLSSWFNKAGGYTLTDLPLPFTTADVMTRLGGSAVVFDVDDFVQETYRSYPLGSITINAGPKSLRWEGSLTVTVTNTLKLDLALFNGTEVPEAFDYPDGDGSKAQGYFYLNPFDFSEYREVLKPLGKYANTLDGDELAVILSTVSGETWASEPTPQVRNLATLSGMPYKVVYNGPAMERYTARTDLASVIILELDETLCTGVTGGLRLHYT